MNNIKTNYKKKCKILVATIIASLFILIYATPSYSRCLECDRVQSEKWSAAVPNDGGTFESEVAETESASEIVSIFESLVP